MQAVATWREYEARERNVPRGRVLKDDAIFEIAQQAPRDAAALARLRTTPRGWERSSSAAGLLEIVHKALDIPKDQLPKLPKFVQQAERTSAAAELLKVLLKIVAEQQGVAPKVLASSDDVEKIAASGENANVPAMQGWRREVFGERALALVRGEIALKFENRKITVFETK